MQTQSICVLGSTGSIGQSTLDVVARHPDILRVYALSAWKRIDELVRQAYTFRAKVAIVPAAADAARFRSIWPADAPMPEIRIGQQALVDTAADPEVTTVMAAIVGAAGLPSVLAAARAGKRILLANK